MADEEKASEQSDPQEKLRHALEKFTTDSAEMLGEIGQAAADVKATKEALLKDQEELTKAKDEAVKSAEKIQEFYATLFAKGDGKDKPAVEAIPEEVKAITKAKKNVDALEANVTAYVEALLGKTGPDGNPLPSIKADLEEKAKELKDLYSKVFDKPAEDRLPLSKEVGDFLVDFTKKKGELEAIKTDIIGYQDTLLGKLQEDGKRTGGIREEIAKESKAHTEAYEAKDKRQKELMDRADALLAGASTAALGKAFSTHKESFNIANRQWMLVFIGAVVAIMLVPLVILLFPTELHLPWWEQLLIRTPILGGAITLVWYASKQRSQNKRLQQEYAYKEDVAMIYIALKKEIEDLGDNPVSGPLKEQVLKVLINAVGENPSSTLESSAHDDKGPAHDAYKKGMDAVTDIIKEVVPKIVKAGS